MTVSDYIAFFLVSKGVKHIFGFQGSAMLKMLDSIEKTKSISYIQNYNEQASAFCAGAYARVTNNIGIALATSGPGATNLITGIADAFCDSVPVLFLTGQERISLIKTRGKARQNGFQDVDIVSMVKPVTKYAVLLDDPENIRYELEKAFYLATSGRKGPVLIDVPLDIQFMKVDENIIRPFYISSKETQDLSCLSEIVIKIKKAKRPLILAGGGVRSSGTENLLQDFCKKTNIPVVTTLNGRDVCTHALGFAGLYGNTVANLALLNADLLLVFGARMASQHTGKERQSYNVNGEIIRIDIDRYEFGHSFIKEDISIPCDLNSFFEKILPLIDHTEFKTWNEKISLWNKLYSDQLSNTRKDMNPIKVIRCVLEKIAQNAVVTVDVGENQMWVAQAFKSGKNTRFLSSSGFGSMGFSLPAAIGASFVSDQIIAFTGDGGLQMNLQELNTLSLLRRNVKCFVFNNGCLGLMRSIQKKFYNSRFYGNTSEVFSCPDLRKLASVYNIKFICVKTDGDLKKIDQVLCNDEPWLVEVKIDPEIRAMNRYDDPALRKKIFLDFDGTLINSQDRLYYLFKELCPSCNLSKEEYKAIKRSRVSQKKILKDKFGYTDGQIEIFKEKWMNKVEEKQRIENDFPFEGITSFLERISKKGELYLVTNRQKKDLVIYQLKKFGWVGFFKNVLVTEGKQSKTQLIRSVTDPLPYDVLIGDTGEDINCAKELNIFSIAVCWGTLSKKVLSDYKPNYIVERISDLDNCTIL